jgi:hypothetical protein
MLRNAGPQRAALPISLTETCRIDTAFCCVVHGAFNMHLMYIVGTELSPSQVVPKGEEITTI